MPRPLGSLNTSTSQTLSRFAELVEKHDFEPMDFIFMVAKGKVPGTRKVLPLEVRYTASKELLAYGYSKLATLRVEAPVSDEPLQITWDLFPEPGEGQTRIEPDPAIVELIE